MICCILQNPKLKFSEFGRNDMLYSAEPKSCCFVLMIKLQKLTPPPFETPLGIHTELAKFLKVCELMREIFLRFTVCITQPQWLGNNLKCCIF